MARPFVLLSLHDVWLSCFYIWAITKNAAVNINYKCFMLNVEFTSKYVPHSPMAGSYNESVELLVELPTFSTVCVSFLLYYQQN